MPTEDHEQRPPTLLKKAISQHQEQPWYAKTIHAAVVIGFLTLFVVGTSHSLELKQEGVIIMGTALVILVYAFGGDGAKIISRFLGKKE
jgi:hypothetical protein